jgi:hypothetical protein
MHALSVFNALVPNDLLIEGVKSIRRSIQWTMLSTLVATVAT